MGVIDFGDIVTSWTVNEARAAPAGPAAARVGASPTPLQVAIGAAYATVSSYGQSDGPIEAAVALLEGVGPLLPLTPLERRLLPVLTACRLAISVTLGAYSYQQQPDCEYLLLHAKPGWTSLAALWSGQGVAEGVAARFEEALRAREK